MTKQGYSKMEIREKFNAALRDAIQDVISGAETRVRISTGNTKMGDVASVSTLPFNTCPACCLHTCGVNCYAAKLANLRPNVRRNYAINTAMVLYNPGEYWKQVSRAAAGVRFFRFHVSGDIINADYFASMIDCVRNNPHTEFLCFTKRFNVVNNWISANGELPHNLHILFSGWEGLTPCNPYNVPETNVVPRGGVPADGWKMCSGNCFECAISGAGCWGAKRGDVIAFNMH